jgi:hypothetical protein
MNVQSRKNTLSLLLSLLVVAVVVGCSSSDTHKADAPTPTTQMPMPIPTIQPLPGNPTKEAVMTQFAREKEREMTRVALTAAPTITPGPPPVYPTYTPELGMLGPEPDRSHNLLAPRFTSGWRGWINGDIIEIRAGCEGPGGDQLQGLITVKNWSDPDVIPVYRTPQRLGAVRIFSVQGTQFNLVTEDGQHTFAFELTTRQWVAPPPLPTPSVFVSPVPSPSTSPLPSPSASP